MSVSTEENDDMLTNAENSVLATTRATTKSEQTLSEEEEEEDTTTEADHEEVDSKELTLIEKWKSLAESAGVRWPLPNNSSVNIDTILSDESGAFVRLYESASKQLALSFIRKERNNDAKIARMPAHYGRLRTALFLLVSHRFGLLSDAQQAALSANKKWFEYITSEAAHAFAWHYLVTADFFEKLMERCLARSIREKYTDDDIKRALAAPASAPASTHLDNVDDDDDDNNDNDKDNMSMNIDVNAVVRATMNMKRSIPNWLVAFVIMVPSSEAVAVLRADEAARYSLAMRMDSAPHFCTLADLGSGLRGVSLMDSALKKPNEYEGLKHVAQKSVMFKKFGVRNAVDIAEHVYDSDDKARMLAFHKSFIWTYEYIVSNEKPRITVSEFKKMSSTRQSEVRIALSLRNHKHAIAAAEGKDPKDVKTMVEAIANMWLCEMVRTHEELQERMTNADISNTSLYDNLKNITQDNDAITGTTKCGSLPEAFMWLHCSFAPASSFADFWWASQGAREMYHRTARRYSSMKKQKSAMEAAAAIGDKKKKKAAASSTPPPPPTNAAS